MYWIALCGVIGVLIGLYVVMLATLRDTRIAINNLENRVKYMEDRQ